MASTQMHSHFTGQITFKVHSLRLVSHGGIRGLVGVGMRPHPTHRRYEEGQHHRPGDVLAILDSIPAIKVGQERQHK